MEKKIMFLVVEMYSTICAEWAVDHFGIGLTQIDPLLTKMNGKLFLHFRFQ